MPSTLAGRNMRNEIGPPGPSIVRSLALGDRMIGPRGPLPSALALRTACGVCRWVGVILAYIASSSALKAAVSGVIASGRNTAGSKVMAGGGVLAPVAELDQRA